MPLSTTTQVDLRCRHTKRRQEHKPNGSGENMSVILVPVPDRRNAVAKAVGDGPATLSVPPGSRFVLPQTTRRTSTTSTDTPWVVLSQRRHTHPNFIHRRKLPASSTAAPPSSRTRTKSTDRKHDAVSTKGTCLVEEPSQYSVWPPKSWNTMLQVGRGAPGKFTYRRNDACSVP